MVNKQVLYFALEAEYVIGHFELKNERTYLIRGHSLECWACVWKQVQCGVLFVHIRVLQVANANKKLGNIRVFVQVANDHAESARLADAYVLRDLARVFVQIDVTFPCEIGKLIVVESVADWLLIFAVAVFDFESELMQIRHEMADLGLIALSADYVRQASTLSGYSVAVVVIR